MDTLPGFLKLRILNALPQARVVTADDVLLAPVDLAATADKKQWEHWRAIDVVALREAGFVVVDGAVGDGVARGVRDEVMALAEAGRLKRAGMKSSVNDTWVDGERLAAR